MEKTKHNFNERETEYDNATKDQIPVWISPKYEEAKRKVVEMIDSEKYGLTDNDFWILMNKTSKGDKMAYTSLIISHNGCLKINDALDNELKFKPSCVRENQNGYEDSLVYTYASDEQGIYEVGEISKSNYKQTNGRYPYAMAYKRLFDRVVLKNSKLAYSGVYSDSEADEFKDPITEKEEKKTLMLMNTLNKLVADYPVDYEALLKTYNVSSNADMTKEQLEDAIAKINKKYVKENK